VWHDYKKTIKNKERIKNKYLNVVEKDLESWMFGIFKKDNCTIGPCG
jgi:hypothetical protein